MKRAYLLYGLLAVGVLAWWLSGLGGDDEARIRAQLDRMSELVAKEPGEKALEAADRARRLGELFTEPFELKIDPVGVEVGTAAELVRPFVGLRRQAQTVRLDFDVEELEIAEGLPAASMSALARVSGKIDGRNRSETFRVAFAWKKDGGDWRIEILRVTERVEGGLF